MKLSDDYEREWNQGLPLIYMAVGASLFFIAMIALVFFLNRKEPEGSSEKVITSETAFLEESEAESSIEQGKQDDIQGRTEAIIDERSPGEKTVEELISGSKLTSDDLDIWDETPIIEKETETQKKDEVVTAEGYLEGEAQDEDPSKGGTYTKIILDSGLEEWIPIIPSLDKHDYNFAGLDFQNPIMTYQEDREKKSYMGVDVSKYQGFVDYNKLKKAGVSFVMIRIGARGYGSGQLILDEYFADNMKGATDAGLSVGAYFFSQAISIEEALEEVALVVEELEGYDVTYPVAFDMESIPGDDARIDYLSRNEKTDIASVFLNGIKDAGYKPIIYGKKEWLLTKIDLTKLTEYDVWLAQEEHTPDFPYEFDMWQYSTSGKIDGIAGKADLNISFIDYDFK